MSVESKPPQALVIGAGIAGIKSALELAEAGVRVHVCDISPNIGGALFQMERWFPDNHCGLCQTLPVFDRGLPSQYCLRRGLQHPNITFHSGSSVEKVDGETGHFFVSLHKNPEKIDAALCTGCGLCAEACPISVDSSSGHKAVYLSNPQALRKTYVIDNERCTLCSACTGVCPTGAIDFSRGPQSIEIAAGAIIVSTGFEEFDPESASQYGYGRYPNVITGFDLEHMLDGNSPSSGKVVRPSDGKVPSSIAFIQCAGSRDNKNDFCSSTCCMYAAREATIIKEQNKDTAVEIFCMDMRSFGKGHQRYADRACDELGIKFTRGRVPVIKQDFSNGNLLINRIDDNGKIVTAVFEMAILSASQRPSGSFKELGKVLNIGLNKWGFAATSSLSSAASTREGIYVCGSASGPKDISDSIATAGAAAGMTLALLKPQKSTQVQAAIAPTCTGAAVFFCNCSGQISKQLDFNHLKEFARNLPGVKIVEEFDRLCSEEQSTCMKEVIKKNATSTVIIAACSIFRPAETIDNIPAIPVNIREELVWPHTDPIAVIAKAEKMLAMALENSKWRSPESPASGKIEQKALVLGAGLSGLETALAIADRGFEVDLVEKSALPGGHTAHVYSILGGDDTRTYLNDLIKNIRRNELIHLHTGTELIQVTGNVGNFSCTTASGSGEKANLKAGVIIVATGAGEFSTSLYGYRQAESIITQAELEELIAGGADVLGKVNSLVMIQCVGSREKDRPYCSRICCSQAIKNALSLKSKYPELKITILYRDMMSYGFQEEFYTQAREKGVLFLRHDIDHKPVVKVHDDNLEITAFDASLGKEMKLHPDLLVLSAAIIPGETNKALSEILGIELTADYFFKEIEPKFQPVDSTREGIFICGLASSPMSIPEAITQARAAGHRAASLLSNRELQPMRAISEVNERRCTGCGLCVAACPYQARVRDEVKRVTMVIKELCRGCGTCSAICPNGAATQREFTGKQVFSLLDAAI